jgi:hypothetical protein
VSRVRSEAPGHAHQLRDSRQARGSRDRARAAQVVSREFQFDRHLRDLDLPGLNAVLEDGELGDLTWAQRWTWLSVLTLVARHPDGLTWATLDGICKVRKGFWLVGSSIPQVKRHIRSLQRMGFLLRFKEVRPHQPKAKMRLHVTVVLFADADGFRTARSREARELVHGWLSGVWAVQPDASFRGPLIGATERRPVSFADLVPLNAELACSAAARQRPPATEDHFAPKVTPRIQPAGKDPRQQHQNRASAGVSQAPEPPRDLADGDELADADQAAEATRLPLRGPAAHRRPKGGTLGHPRPQGGSRGSQDAQEARAS